jgi:hypothetical protein
LTISGQILPGFADPAWVEPYGARNFQSAAVNDGLDALDTHLA